MSVRDFAILTFVCVVWAANNIVSKYVVAILGVPPLFYATARFLVVALAAAPWLFPAPRPLWRVIAIALLLGGFNFAFVFVGLRTATPSAAAVVSQLGVPITTLLSVVMLGEKIRWRRGLGIALTFAGAMLVMWSPRGLTISMGLVYVLLSAAVSSLGAVMMKQVEGVRPLQFQAWVGFASIWPLGLLSLVFEPGATSVALHAGWSFVAAALFSGLVVSVTGHTLYYALIQRYEANLISPLTLMTPLFTIALGVAITHDPFGPRMAVGSAVALVGVLIIALRPNQVAPRLLAIRGSAD
jgi:drug/metabolite transporter (DMT)-like permease